MQLYNKQINKKEKEKGKGKPTWKFPLQIHLLETWTAKGGSSCDLNTWSMYKYLNDVRHGDVEAGEKGGTMLLTSLLLSRS